MKTPSILLSHTSFLFLIHLCSLFFGFIMNGASISNELRLGEIVGNSLCSNCLAFASSYIYIVIIYQNYLDLESGIDNPRIPPSQQQVTVHLHYDSAIQFIHERIQEDIDAMFNLIKSWKRSRYFFYRDYAYQHPHIRNKIRIKIKNQTIYCSEEFYDRFFKWWKKWDGVEIPDNIFKRELLNEFGQHSTKHPVRQYELMKKYIYNTSISLSSSDRLYTEKKLKPFQIQYNHHES